MRTIKINIRDLLVACSVIIVVAVPIGAGAAGKEAKKAPATKPADISKEVTQSYDADPAVQIGMVVKLKDKDPKTVEPLSSDDADKMLGIVIPSSNATIVLSPQKVTKQQVLVTNTGHFNVLVSNQNGPIKVGDYVMVSAVAGTGMKTTEK